VGFGEWGLKKKEIWSEQFKKGFGRFYLGGGGFGRSFASVFSFRKELVIALK